MPASVPTLAALASSTPASEAVVPAATAAGAAEGDGHGLSGLTGFAADVIDAIGEFGVGTLAFVETVFPPIPSEIILSLSGYLAQRGSMNVVLVVIAATVGAVLGALVLYGFGAWFGEDRARRLLTVLPLVNDSDYAEASEWFRRHGHPVVFFGRFIPIVRSLVSLPAGAQRMPLVSFLTLTTIGSAIWNTLLVGAGYALGTQYERIEEYMGYLDYLVYAAVIAIVVWFVARKVRRRGSTEMGADPAVDGGAPGARPEASADGTSGDVSPGRRRKDASAQRGRHRA